MRAQGFRLAVLKILMKLTLRAWWRGQTERVYTGYTRPPFSSLLYEAKQRACPSVRPSIRPWLYIPLLVLGRYFSFLSFYTVDRAPWTGDRPRRKAVTCTQERTNME
jgi:hypothetical protein